MTIFIMGTGSRSLVIDPKRKEVYEVTEKYMLELYKINPDIVFISGMAEGWDEVIAWICLRNHIPYIVAIPTANYRDFYWGPKGSHPSSGSLTGHDRRAQFDTLDAGAQEKIIVCQTLYVNGVHANKVRNQWMVAKCSYALVYDAGSTGTKDAVARLKQANKMYETYPFKKATGKGGVVHCKKDPHDVYIGRPSKWGNPFTIGVDGDRATVIAMYEKWLMAQPELVAQAKAELKGKVLGCYCAPLPCHGDVLVKVANAESTSPT